MERSYPKRYNRPEIDLYRALISKSFGCVAGNVIIEKEMDPGWSEFLLIDEASNFPRTMTGDPGQTDGFLRMRADVVYIDEEFGTIRFSGPLGGYRRGQIPPASEDSALPVPLPVLLWKTGVEPGVWVAVSNCPHGTGDKYAVTLVRVTGTLLERGRRLSRELAWSESSREA